jgi:conjugal transfer pilus assembly protein TraV
MGTLPQIFALPHAWRAAALAPGTSGCAVLGGNVKGSFSCRAPEGNCAPTSVIDERRRTPRAKRPKRRAPRLGTSPAWRDIRRAAARRARSLSRCGWADARSAGRRSAAADQSASQFQDPASRREVARALARAVNAAAIPTARGRRPRLRLPILPIPPPPPCRTCSLPPCSTLRPGDPGQPPSPSPGPPP